MEPDQELGRNEQTFDLSGGALCLDFVNTLGDRPICENEHLNTYSDLLRWGVQSGVLDSALGQSLSERALEKHEQADLALEKALELRELLFRIFAQLALGNKLEPEDLGELNCWLRGSLPHLRITSGPKGFRWQWEELDQSLDSVLWSVVRSAAELLISEESSLVRQCASKTCSWLFVDRSRNHRRRWCDMQTCGNRAKARRHYRRKKQRES